MITRISHEDAVLATGILLKLNALYHSAGHSSGRSERSVLIDFIFAEISSDKPFDTNCLISLAQRKWREYSIPGLSEFIEDNPVDCNDISSMDVLYKNKDAFYYKERVEEIDFDEFLPIVVLSLWDATRRAPHAHFLEKQLNKQLVDIFFSSFDEQVMVSFLERWPFLQLREILVERRHIESMRLYHMPLDEYETKILGMEKAAQ